MLDVGYALENWVIIFSRILWQDRKNISLENVDILHSYCELDSIGQ